MMRLPVLRHQIDLHIARARRFLSKLNDRVLEIGACAAIPETGMQHAHRLAVGGAEFIAAEALVVPDILEQTFGRLR